MTVNETIDGAITELRQRFEDEHADNIAEGLYDTRDITRLQTDDVYAGCFVRHATNNVTRAVGVVHSSLTWRKEMEVNDLTEKSFPRWVHDLSAMYYHKEDKDGRPVLISHVGKCKKDAELHHMQKQYIAWIFDKHFLRRPEDRVAVCFDMTGAGISNMDIELIKFQVTCFTTYYPAFLAYMLVFDMPWILTTIWRVIRTLLSAEQQKFVIFVKGEEILQYIGPGELLSSMGGKDTFEYKYMPTESSMLSISESDGVDASPTADGDTPNSGRKKKVTFAAGEDAGTSSSGNKHRKTRTAKSSRASRGSNEENVFKGTLLTVSPAEEFLFVVQDEEKETVDVLTLFNCTDKLVAYKVKTTSPASYRVRPSSGVINSQATATINTILLPGCHMAAKEDRFLLMAMPVDEEVSITSPRLKELWQNATLGGDTNYMEHRLGCTVLLGDTVDGDADDDQGLLHKMNHLSSQMESLLDNQREVKTRLRWLQLMNILLFCLVLALSAAIYWRDWSTKLPRSDNDDMCPVTTPFNLHLGKH